MKSKFRLLIIIAIVIGWLANLSCFRVFQKTEFSTTSTKNYYIKSVRVIKHHKIKQNIQILKGAEITFRKDRFVVEEYKTPLTKQTLQRNDLLEYYRYVIEETYKEVIESKIKKINPISLKNKYKTELPEEIYGIGTIELEYQNYEENKIRRKTTVVDRFPGCLYEYNYNTYKSFLKKCSKDICDIYKLNEILEGANDVMAIYQTKYSQKLKTAENPDIGRTDWKTLDNQYDLHEVFKHKGDRKILIEKLKKIIKTNPEEKIRKNAKRSLALILRKNEFRTDQHNH